MMTLLILICSFIIATVLLCIFFRMLINKKFSSVKFKISDIDDYYFDEYEKQVTIYKNGNGIIIHKFVVIVKDINKFKKIRRKLNISDGAKTSRFPTLDEMRRTPKSDRFKDFGFWYSSENNIISNVTESYWDDNSPHENKKIKNDPKELRWIFRINKNKIQIGVPYEIRYIISIPGLSPLEDGRLNPNLQNEPDINTVSCMKVDHKIKKLKYTISFEDGIDLESVPVGKCRYAEQDSSNELDIPCSEVYDILYTKYCFFIEAPKFGSNINISWKYNRL